MLDNPCKYGKGDPRYIDPNRLKEEDVRTIIDYRRACAMEEHNMIEAVKAEVESKKLDVLIRVAKYSVLGTITASLIGAGTLFYTQYYKASKIITGGSNNQDVIALIRLENIERFTRETWNTVRSDAAQCNRNTLKISDIHRKYYPEQYASSFRYYKGKAKKQ